MTPDPVEATGTYDAWVVREGLVPSGHIVPPGSSGEEFFVNATAAQSYINFFDLGSNVNSWLNLAIVRPGDQIIIDHVPYEVMRWEPSLRRALVSTPLLTSYTDKQVTLKHRPGRGSTPVSMDFLDRLPSDYLELSLVSSLTTGDDAQTLAGSTDVTLSVEAFDGLAVRPGDLLVLLEGGDSTVDVGNGAGVFPIKEILGATARLMDALTTTGSFRYAIRRKVPNEG